MTASVPGHHSRIAVDLDAGGSLTGYRHDAATHRLALDFDAVLPLALDAPRTAREFAIRMDPDEPVARGEVVSEPLEGARRLIWRLHSPPWTVGYPFESIIKPNGGGYALVIRPLAQ